ncbi:MAG TPA: hypothetical protein VLN44_06590, partial [Pyrinomonadaceae bacterium]|nr:hypothetical protein [Pyrinomonadaceae bacterium]
MHKSQFRDLVTIQYNSDFALVADLHCVTSPHVSKGWLRRVALPDGRASDTKSPGNIVNLTEL